MRVERLRVRKHRFCFLPWKNTYLNRYHIPILAAKTIAKGDVRILLHASIIKEADSFIKLRATASFGLSNERIVVNLEK